MATKLWESIERQAGRGVGRFQSRVSAADISRATGISEAVLSKWKNKPVLPKVEHLAALRDRMGMDYTELLEAVLADKGYLPPPAAVDLTERRAARSTGRESEGQARRRAQDEAGEEPQVPPGE